MKWDTVNAVDSWHFNKAQRNKKKKIQQKSMNNWAYLVKWKENEFRVGKKKYYDFFQYTYWIWYFSATKPEWDFTPLLRSYTLLSTHFLQLLHCLKSTHLQQVNVVTKNTSICQNISVQCQHILKERIKQKCNSNVKVKQQAWQSWNIFD